MGENYRAAGFATVKDFVFAMTKSESEHLTAFANFVGNDKAMLKALQDKDWAAFAERYNGKNYKNNDYDTKLKTAYDHLNPVKPVPAKKKP